ncbi:AP2-like ethylene-responsive transcription factor At2g41710 isoform X2 [Impatiens glandulifera]|uniref:AP2-like ethylene-responsive transcription factor At2g41710 isoform X2 n=1 Tax=Impatiens glandulifera TaxID=253017 RepID=UPI001FB068ED|nr:AP2-like ethylene-responsive transcription factor At2g41710 isoform X2 [Impatiens glandulifera]
MASSSSGPIGLKIEAVNSSVGGSGTGTGETSEVAAAAASGSDHLFVYRGLKKAKKDRGCTAKERISKMPPCAAGKRSSIYRGVTRHRWTGRYEAHLWDKSTWNQNQNKKGKQVYLGAYDDEEAAARAYDLAALKYWGPGTLINFPVSDYSRDLEEMKNVTREDYLASLRRKSSGFSRGMSKYRGLPSGRWDPSGGRMAGSDYLSSSYYPDASGESEYAGGFCIERKIDLTPYIKWWGSSKINTNSKSTEETKHSLSDDIGMELKTLESSIQRAEPYQMPRLGVVQDVKKNKGSALSAMSVLSQSAAFKNLQEKASKMKAVSLENDENEKKCNVNDKSSYGKAIEKQPSDECLGFGSEAGRALTLDRSVFPLSPLLSANAPLLTNYSSIDPLSDSIPWTTLVPVLPTGLPQVTKTETSTNYGFFQQEQ